MIAGKPIDGDRSAFTWADSGCGALIRWAGATIAVFTKEAKIEGRSRLALGTTLLFSVCAVCAMAYTIGQMHLDTAVQAALLWVTLLFSAMSGLARPFVREDEMRTADYLRLYAPPSAVFTGKLAFNAAVTATIELVTVTLFFIVIPPGMIRPDIGLLVSVFALGGLGLAATSTFVAALVSQGGGGSRGGLFFVAAFPALVPLLMASAHATFSAMVPVLSPPNYAANSLVMIGAYDVVVLAAAYLLFGPIWSEA